MKLNQALIIACPMNMQELKAQAAAAQTATEAAEAEQQRVLQAALQAAEAGAAHALEAQHARLQRLEQDVQLHWKERRVRQALEHALSIMKGCEGTLSQGTELL